HTRSKRDWSSDVCSSDLWLYLNQTLYHHIVAPDQTMQVGHFLRTHSYHPINHRAIMMVYSYDPLMNLQFFLSLYDKFLHHPLSIDLDLPIYLLTDLNVVQQKYSYKLLTN